MNAKLCQQKSCLTPVHIALKKEPKHKKGRSFHGHGYWGERNLVKQGDEMVNTIGY